MRNIQKKVEKKIFELCHYSCAPAPIKVSFVYEVIRLVFLDIFQYHHYRFWFQFQVDRKTRKEFAESVNVHPTILIQAQCLP